MRKIENFAQISDLLNAQLKRGVITNNFLRGDDYTREIANGLYIHETGGALMLFRERGDHLVMTFYLHPNAVLSLPETDRPVVTELSCRAKDADAMANAAEQFCALGFREVLRRTRRTRKPEACNAPCSGNRKSRQQCRRRNHVGYRAPAILYGNNHFRDSRHSAHTSYKQCRNLCRIKSHRTCRRSRPRRLLCQHGRLCRLKLQGKQMGRAFCTGYRNKHAPDGKHRAQSTYMAPGNSNISHNRTDCHLCIQASDERRRRSFRNGNLRSRRTDWCVHRLAQ